VLLILLGDALVMGQSTYPYYAPKLENSKNGAVHDFPLGVLSATGRMQHGATAIAVKDVGPGGPGEKGGLQVGDVIIAIGGKKMPPYSKELDAGLMGPQTVLATALDIGCSEPDPKLKLTVVRNAEQVSLEIGLPA
jgi:C-terminal processing protease CtpA/Prc